MILARMTDAQAEQLLAKLHEEGAAASQVDGPSVGAGD